MRPRRHVIALVLLAALATPGCRHKSKHPNALQGVIELDERDLGFEVAGRLTALKVDEGDRVTKGQLLGVLDDQLQRSVQTARQAEAAATEEQLKLLLAGSRPEDISAKRSQLIAARANERLTKQILDRNRALAGTPGATPPAEVAQLEARYRAAVGERRVLQAQLRVLQHGARPEEIAAAKSRAAAAKATAALETERLRRHHLSAPLAGVVLEVMIEQGELVSPNVPVLTMADVDHPYTDVFVPEGKIGGVRVGSSARVFVDSATEPFAGKVEFIARRTEFTPRFLFSERERPNLVVRVRIRIADPRQQLHAGVPAFAYIDTAKAAP